MIGHRKVFDGKIGDNGLALLVWEHCDHKGALNVSISRHGATEEAMTSEELKALGARLIYVAQEEHQRNATSLGTPNNDSATPVSVSNGGKTSR